MTLKIASMTIMLLLTAAALSCVGPNATDDPPSVPQATTAPLILPAADPAPTRAPNPLANTPAPATPLPDPEATLPDLTSAEPTPVPPEPPKVVTGLTLAYAEHRADRQIPSLAIPTGRAVALTAYAVHLDGTHVRIPDHDAAWTTNEPERFLIDPNGTIFAPFGAQGELTLRHAGLTQTLSLTAEGPPYRGFQQITALVILPENTVLTGPGTQATLEIRAVYQDGGTGPLPQVLTYSPEFHTDTAEPATVDSSGTLTALEPGTVRVTASLAQHRTIEAAFVHIVPPPHGVQPGTPCVIDAPQSKRNGPTQIHANALKLNLYPSRDSQQEADRVAASVSGEVAYHIPSEKAYALHIPCPGTTAPEIEDGLQLLMATLLALPSVSNAAPLPVELPPNIDLPPASPQTAPTAPQMPAPAPREGDHILNIRAQPAISRLAPSQAQQVKTLTALLTDGGTQAIDPGDPALTYRLRRLRVEDAAGNPEATRDVLINSRGEYRPNPNARTASYHLVIDYKGHRTRVRIDVRGTPAPVDTHDSQCAPSSGHTGQIMLEITGANAAATAQDIASALGGKITKRYQHFGGHVLTVPCSGPFALNASLQLAREFEDVTRAYVHIPTVGDSGPSMTEPTLTPSQALLTLRVGQSHTLNITTAAFDDGTTGPIPPEEQESIQLRSLNPAVGHVSGRTITANSAGATTVEILYRGKIATTVALRAE